MTIIKKSEGFTLIREGLPDVFLTANDARELMLQVRRQCRIEDIECKLADDPDIDDEQVTDDEIERICDIYESRLENDNTWSTILDDVIAHFDFENNG